MRRRYEATPATVNAAKVACQVQNASNLYGVMTAHAEQLKAIRDESKLGNDEMEAHPVNRAFLDKLCSLAGIQNIASEKIVDAHNACDELAAGRAVEIDD